ncbi:MerR family transcriptional regulator [Nocardiopsis sp. NRRL B-16309]|uniref:MerR family transcriptional regulator n=1 Tax=Nocardiopsis sp. NRRL B-16309 TaxID=1519494 RepID=UPI0006B06068|nr:MerR family transcriptional regulator [Nocardiopsis sp. NRRL B-16309]KOX15887.1 transcriptional regulator [Nocardiopsis sp. NRRL B-16309]
MAHTVGEVARMSGQTVRTLHHYHQIGLLVPAGRTASGYRRYSDDDVERLRQILTYRELGFGLDRIAEILDDPGADTRAHLARQHELVTERIERLRAIARGLEHLMEADTMELDLTAAQRLELFGDFDVDAHAEEARRRWGGSDAFARSQRRVSSYAKADWERHNAEAAQVYRALARLMDEGAPADGEAAMDLSERHREHITRWFYDCTTEIHRGLGRLYVDDARFTATIDAHAEGLSAYLCGAFAANADRQEGRGAHGH